MPLSNIEYNSLIGRLRERIQDLVNRYDERNIILGNIGEKFVGYCICHSLWKLGYPISFYNHPHSYLLTPRFGANADGVGGIDFKLSVVDLNERIYRFLIEVKNWRHYPITANMFNNEILDRYNLDLNGEHHRMITMNTRNIGDIRARCEENNIHILPISQHITPEMIQDNASMRSAFNSFIDSFTNQIKVLAPERAYPNITIEENEENKYQYIIRDLLLTVPYPIIQDRYNVTKNYIIRLASYIRSFNFSLPDRRRKNWRLQWEIQA
jgi:hypothetical protein